MENNISSQDIANQMAYDFFRSQCPHWECI